MIANAQTLAAALQGEGLRIVSGGTDNHLMMVDVRSANATGKAAEATLGKVHITVNKNMVPYDTRSPFVTSGVRIGTPALTTRGFTPEVMPKVADLIDRTLKGEDPAAVRAEVKALTADYPMP